MKLRLGMLLHLWLTRLYDSVLTLMFPFSAAVSPDESAPEKTIIDDATNNDFCCIGAVIRQCPVNKSICCIHRVMKARLRVREHLRSENVEIPYLTIKLLCEIDQKMPYSRVRLLF